eukprot:15433320-Alexandrium_andersonii.AAC.1
MIVATLNRHMQLATMISCLFGGNSGRPRSASGARAGPLRQQIWHLHYQRRRLYPSRTFGDQCRGRFWAMQVKLRTPQASC